MRAVVAGLTLLAFGCIGREVVGERSDADPPACDSEPPECHALGEPPVWTPRDESVFDVPPAPCDEWIVLDALPDAADLELRCADVTVDLSAGAEVELRDARLTDVRLRLRGEPGATLRLADSVAENLYVSAEGHAWLEVTEQSSIAGLVFDAAPEVEGSVLTLSDSDVSDFAIRTRARGELRLTGARLQRGELLSSDLVSVESTLTEVVLRAHHAILADTRITQGDHDLGTARVVRSSFQESRIGRCGSVRMVGSSLSTSVVAACDSPLVLAGAAVTASRVYGTVEASGVSATGSFFAPGPDGTLLFTDSTLRSSAFCDTEHFIASSGSVVCVGCEPDIRDAIVDETYVFAPKCPALEAAAALTPAPP